MGLAYSLCVTENERIVLALEHLQVLCCNNHMWYNCKCIVLVTYIQLGIVHTVVCHMSADDLKVVVCAQGLKEWEY